MPVYPGARRITAKPSTANPSVDQQSRRPSALDDAEHALGLAVAGVPYIGWHLNVVLDGSIGQKRVATSISFSRIPGAL
jgi:hypothetical protein